MGGSRGRRDSETSSPSCVTFACDWYTLAQEKGVFIRTCSCRQRKRVDRTRENDTGKTFVRCRLVARDFKPKHEGPKDDLFVATPPLEAKKALFAFVAVVREKRRAQGHDEVKLMFERHISTRSATRKNGSSCWTNSKNLGGAPS